MNMVITAEDIEQILREKLDIKEIQVTDMKGGNHWEVIITATEFNDLNRIKREQLVQKILAEQLANESIHALKLRARGTNE